MMHLPMRQWRHRHVIHWLEKNEHLAQLAGIFYEWRIDGGELLEMHELHIPQPT